MRIKISTKWSLYDFDFSILAPDGADFILNMKYTFLMIVLIILTFSSVYGANGDANTFTCSKVDGELHPGSWRELTIAEEFNQLYQVKDQLQLMY